MPSIGTQPVTSLALLCVLTLGAPSRAAASGGAGYGYGTSTSSSGERETFQYALIQRGHNTSCQVNGDNTWRTIGKLQDEVERTGNEVFYFAIGDHEYVIRDAALVQRGHEVMEPVSRLGAEQGRLGSMQGELGRRQGEMGKLQGEASQMEAHLASLEARDDDRHRAELDELRQELRGLMDQVRALSVRERELGAQQQELGRRQRDLGEQQRRASLLANDQLRSLTDKAIASGKAETIASD
jgi:predicted RNase H-like nuclease (RuvC/YqgF family)